MVLKETPRLCRGTVDLFQPSLVGLQHGGQLLSCPRNTVKAIRLGVSGRGTAKLAASPYSLMVLLIPESQTSKHLNISANTPLPRPLAPRRFHVLLALWLRLLTSAGRSPFQATLHPHFEPDGFRRPPAQPAQSSLLAARLGRSSPRSPSPWPGFQKTAPALAQKPKDSCENRKHGWIHLPMAPQTVIDRNSTNNEQYFMTSNPKPCLGFGT